MTRSLLRLVAVALVVASCWLGHRAVTETSAGAAVITFGVALVLVGAGVSVWKASRS